MELKVEVIISLIAGVGSLIATAIILTWWLSGQFSKNRHMFHNLIAGLQLTVEEKMDDHETKDESRYTSLGEQIKQIQLRNAAQDGARLLKRGNQ